MERAGSKTKSFSAQLQGVKQALVGWGFTQLVREAVSFGSSLTDLSAQTGIGVGALQRLDAVGRTVGVSLEQAAKGVGLMQKNLIGDKGAQAAVKALGLSVKDLLDQEPDKAFIDIASAIAKIPDPATRTAVAIEILGKSGQTLLPLLLSDIEKVAAGTIVMSDDVVAALDTFDDTWADVSRAAMASIGTLIGSLGSLDGVLRLLSANPFMGNTGDQSGAKNIAGFVDAIRGIYDLPATAPPALDAIPPAAGATGKALDALLKSQDALNKETELSIKAAEEYQKQIEAIADTLTGKALAKKVQELTLAYGRLTDAQKDDAVVTQRLVDEVEKLFKAGARLSPQLLELWQRHDKLTDVRRTEEELLLRLASRESAYSTILAKTGANLQIVSAEQQAQLRANAQELIMRDAQARGLEEYNQYLQHSAYLTSVATAETEDAGVAVESLGSIWKTVGDAITGGFVQMLSGARSFKDGIVSIFNSIVTQILGDFTNRFVSGIINIISGSKGGISAAFDGVFGAAGAQSAGKFLNAFSVAFKSLGWVALGALAVWAGKKLWDWITGMFNNADRRNAPDVPSGGGPDPMNPNNPYVDDSGNPYQPGDPGGYQPDPNVPAGTSGPDWSHLHQLNTGTNGQFPNWGTGTPVMLHGREAVVPYSDRGDWNMGGSGGGTPIVMMVDGRVFGEVMAPSIAEAIQRVGVARV